MMSDMESSQLSQTPEIVSPQPEISQQVPVPKKKMPRIFGVVVVLLLLVAGAAFAFTYFQEPVVEPGKPVTTPIITETPIPVSDSSTEGWNMYTNTKHNFSFKYPAEWTIKSDDGVVTFYREIEAYQQDSTHPGGKKLVNEYQVKVLTLTTIVATEIDTVVTEYKDKLKLYDIETTSIKNGIKVDGLIPGYENPGAFSGLFLQGKNNDVIYFEPELDKKTLDQILSTFEFTEIDETLGKFCGGIAGVQCPEGYACELEGNYPDAGGTCQK